MAEKAVCARQAQAAVVRTIGARMRAARELCNLSQSAAAKRLGYSNSSKLSKVEGATDTNSVPLWLILRAASVYEVSVDYLFGVSEDWEVGARMTQERETSAWMFDAWEAARRRDMDVLRRLHDKLSSMSESVSLMFDAISETEDALRAFESLNKRFADMRGGARLVNKVLRAVEAGNNAKARMARFKVECQSAGGAPEQLCLRLG
ncbi:MAG: helix-turn-helix transcriptional regulator [Rhodocyclaceae bacterium]|nr:helix-turn-helix transcriptional regulator [Rhodocyclaceae bacterium]